MDKSIKVDLSVSYRPADELNVCRIYIPASPQTKHSFLHMQETLLLCGTLIAEEKMMPGGARSSVMHSNTVAPIPRRLRVKTATIFRHRNRKNALFGNLQVVTAGRLGLDPVLIAAVNSVGGVMGKMISLQTIAIAAAATGMSIHDQARLFRFTLKHSILLASMVGGLALIYVYH